MRQMHRRVLRRVGDEKWLAVEGLGGGKGLADATVAFMVGSDRARS